MHITKLTNNSVRFNVYIFNVQPGVTLNYKDGTSRVGKVTANKATKKTVKASVKKAKKKTIKKNRTIKNQKGTISTAKYRVVGNKNSKIYHVMNGQNYHISKANAVYFQSEAAARAAGYRKSLR